ncbi:MAG: hypothetical protein HZA10_00665 [Nitrospirae bacterium]|nr:hypothetical protein [Nitrospirota bacterium]
MAEDTQRNHQELCLLYQNAATNLDSLKKSQWQVYVFYSAVAIALISQANNIKEPYLKILISSLLLCGALMVEFYEAHFRSKIKEYRQILMEVYECFGHPFKKTRISAKGTKTVDPDNFEIAFKYGGCAYLLMVSFLAINTLWPAEYKWTCCSTIWQLVWVSIALIIITILLPCTMDKFVDNLAMRTKKNGVESNIK